MNVSNVRGLGVNKHLTYFKASVESRTSKIKQAMGLVLPFKLCQTHDDKSQALPHTPPFPYLYTCNQAPNEDERDTIQHAIERDISQLKRNRFELSVAFDSPGSLGLLRSATLQLESRISQMKSVVSPMRQLPPELLQQIFLLESYPKVQLGDSLDTNLDVEAMEWRWIVSQVCCSWRNIALSTPELWTTLPRLYIESQESYEMQNRQYGLFKYMIELSQGLPLQLYVECHDSEVDSHLAINLLLEHAEKWDSANINVYAGLLPTFNVVKGRLLSLKYLTLRLWGPSNEDRSVDWGMFSDAPNLQQVSHYSAMDSHMQLPSHQITHYTLWSVFPWHDVQSHWQSLWTSSSILRSLHLWRAVLPNTENAILLPSLTSLICVLGSHQSAAHLNPLVCPVLEELAISGDDDQILSTCLALLQRASKASSGVLPLNRMALCHQIATSLARQEDTFISMLSLVPRLQFLDCPLLPATTLLRLSDITQESRLLPSLVACQFVTSSLIHSPSLPSSLNAFAASRCEASTGDHEQHPIQRLQCLAVNAYKDPAGYQQDFRNLEHLHFLLEGALLAPVHARQSHSGEELQGLPASWEAVKALLGLLQFARWGETRLQTTLNSGDHSASMTRKEVHSLIAQLELCQQDWVSIRNISAAQIDYHAQSLLEDLKSLSKKFKNDRPYLNDLETALSGAIDAWLFATDEQIRSVHWVSDRRALFYVPQHDPIRMTSEGTALGFDVNRTRRSDLMQKYVDVLMDLKPKPWFHVLGYM